MDRTIEQEGFEQDFAAFGGVEYDEADWDDTAVELELLAARVHAARSTGA
jgi:hypothetical protein